MLVKSGYGHVFYPGNARVILHELGFWGNMVKVEEEAPLDPMPIDEGGRRKERRFPALRQDAPGARDSEPASGEPEGEAAEGDLGPEDGSRLAPDAEARPSRTPEVRTVK